MNIGTVAQRAQLPASTLRYYESINLLPSPPRQNGRRIYDETVFVQLRLIKVAKQAGWSLDEIKTLLNSDTAGGHFSAEWRTMAHTKLIELDQQIVEAEAMKAIIHAGLACGCTSAADCDLLSHPDNEEIG